jgi:hypothetical protein
MRQFSVLQPAAFVSGEPRRTIAAQDREASEWMLGMARPYQQEGLWEDQTITTQA